MPSRLQIRGGNSSQSNSYVGFSRELWVNTDTNTLYVHDGSTAGGHLVGGDSDALNLAQAAFNAANADLTLLSTELAANDTFIAAVNSSQNTNIANATTLAQSAYNTANTKLNLSGGTLTGQLNVSSYGIHFPSGSYIIEDNPLDLNITAPYQFSLKTSGGSYQWTLTNNGILSLASGGLTFSDTTTQTTAAAPANYTQSAYTQANTALTLAQSAYNQANNSGSTTAQAAYNQANTASANTIYLAGIETTQNTNITAVNTFAASAYAQANTASSNTVYLTGIETTQNTNITNLQSWLSSNISYLQGIETTQNTNITSINTYAGSGYTVANTASANTIYTQGVDATQNTNITNLQSALSSNVTNISGIDATQNTSISNLSTSLSSNVSYFQGVENTQNTNITSVNTYANSAYALANTNTTNIGYVNTYATSGYGVANTASANTIYTQGVDATQNTNITSVNTFAQAAYNQANTDYTTISTTAGVYGNSTFVPVVTVAANGRVVSVTNTAIALTPSSSYSNSNVISLLSNFGSNTINTSANITAGNLTVTGTITGNINITGNVIGTSSNTTLQAGVYQWVFDNTANTTLPNVANVYINGSYPNGNIMLNPQGLGDVYITPNTQLFVQDTTPSVSPTTGGLVVAGGVGISGNVNIGNLTSIVYTPATTSNVALLISAANTRGGTGYADFLGLTNKSSGATNPSKWIRLDSSGNLQIINSAYTSQLFQLDDVGNLSVLGTVVPTKYTAGQTIKTTMLSNTDVSFTSSVTVSGTSETTIASYSYTPVSTSSYLIIEVFCTYTNGGSNGDTWYSHLRVNGNEITYGYQNWVSATGGGTRSGTLFPLMGRYTNSSTSAVSITITANRGSSDDNFVFNADDGFWLKITEIAR